MVIFYFGADKPAAELERYGFKRRNTILLRSLSGNNEVSRLVSFNYTSRRIFFKNFFINYAETGKKIKDVFFSDLFVFGRFKIGLLNRFFNRIYFQPLKNRYAREGVLGWIYWPNGYMDYKQTGLNLEFVFDADHNLIDDPNLEAAQKGELVNLLKEISNRSKLVVCASKSMLEWFLKNGARQVYRLRNGIDLSRFKKNRESPSKKFSVVYCGILSNWVNYDFFVDLIEKNPDIDFVIIGKSFLNDSYNRLKTFANVVFLGEKSADEVASLLPGFDAGIALYKSDTTLDGDSMKIYEYLAAGLPVVCTNYHSSLKQDFENLLFVGETFEEINGLLKAIKNDSICFDKESVRLFLERSGWDNRINGVMNVLNTRASL